MKSGWVERDAQAIVDRYAREGIGPDLALRIYTTRLLGRDPRLVLHGGGNTSVKTLTPDLLGEPVEVLCIKGSGGDMATVDRARRPAGGAARSAAQAARARQRLATRTWSASSARTCSTRRRPIRRSRRCCMLFCRTSSSTTPMRPRC